MAFEVLKSSVAKLFSAPEQKSAPLCYDSWGLDAFLAPATISNVVVTPQTALKVPAVASAINLISGAMATIPARLMRNIDGSKEVASEHPASRLVSTVANERVSAGALRQRLTTDALLFGNAYAFANRVNGRVLEIVRLDPNAVSVQIDQLTGSPIYRSTTDKGRIFDADELIHIPAPTSLDGVTGIPVIHLAREAIGLAITMEARAAKLFGVSARPSGVIEFTDKLDEDTVKRIAAGWRAAHEGMDNAGRTAILHAGGKFNPHEFKSTDAQFAELWREQIIQIARAFNVPPSMIFELTSGTFANVEAQSRQFVNFTLAPWIAKFRDEFERALLTEDERDTYSIDFETSALIAVDTTAATDRVAKLRAAGVWTANDARRELGLPAHVDGDRLDSPHTTPGAAPGVSDVSAKQGALA